MVMFMWKDSYLVGIELIDNQHKRLFEAITSLKDNLGHLEETSYKEQLQATITFLKDYCIHHFNDEQNHMQSIGFKGYDEHKKKHDKLLGDVGEYGIKLVETDFDHEVVESFLGFLVTWLIYHIGVEDQQIPKKVRTDSLAERGDGVYHACANTIKTVINTLTGLPESEMIYAVDNIKHIKPGVCFSARLINPDDYNSLNVIYSNSLASGMVKEMTNIDSEKFANVMYMALQEITGIIGTKIAQVLSRETGSEISIGTPKRVHLSDIDKTVNSLIMHTQLGALEVIFS